MQELRMATEKEHGIEIDLEAFESEIGKEIDALFTPISIADEAATPPPQAVEDPFGHEMPKRHERSESPPAVQASEPVMQSAEPPAPSAQPFEHPRPVLPPVSSGEPVPASAAESVQEESRIEKITKLVESFEIAYLSLDWDFSRGNVTSLAAALDRLEDHCRARHETESLFKILRAVLNHLASRPDGIPAEVNEVMRDAQGLLKRMLLANGNIGLDDRQALKALIAQVNSIKQKGLSKDEPRTEPSLGSLEARDTVPRPSSGISAIDSDDHYRLERLIERIDGSRFQINTIHAQLDEEIGRLKKIEEICERKPALAPLASRIGAIHLNVQQQVNALLEHELEWRKNSDWLRELVARYASRPAAVDPADGQPSSVPPMDAREAGIPETVEKEDKEPRRGTEKASETFTDHVCVFSLSGQSFAVPTSSVVKVEPLTPKKYRKILDKGFATLKDFKPLFKSLKHGLLSAWQGLPPGVLKSYQFVPIAPETLQASEAPREIGGLILLSNGREHAMIGMESGAVEQVQATVTKIDATGAILGNADLGGGRSANVVNVDWVLKELYGEAASGH